MNFAFRRSIAAILGFGSSNDKQRAFSQIRSHEWQRELGWLDRSGLALPFIAATKEQNLVALLPQRVLGELERRHRDNRRRMTDMFRRFSTIVERFNTEGISYACVKGFSLFPEYCPAFELRHQSDFDFLVSAEDMDAAERILRDIGYRLIVRDASGERRLATPGSIIAGRNAYLYDLQSSSAAELHLHFWEPEANGIQISCPGNALASLEMHSINGVVFPRLQPAYQLTYQLVHLFRHLSGTWARLLWLYEIALFVHSHGSDVKLWREAKSLWHEDARLEQVCLLGLRLASKVFSVSLPDELMEGGKDWAECLLWTSRFSEISLYSDLPGNKASLLFLRPFFDDAAQYRSYRRRRLYPIGSRHALDERLSSSKQSSWRYRLRNGWYQISRLIYHLSSGLDYAELQLRWNGLNCLCKAGMKGRKRLGCN